MRFRGYTENTEQERGNCVKLRNGMLLFHGSYTAVESIRLERVLPVKILAADSI